MEPDNVIYVVTLTGARQNCFELCERYMSRQDCEFQWIVVDDCEPETKTTLGQTILRPEPKWSPGSRKNTLCRNLRVALEHIYGLEDGIVVIAEDDDWYHPGYVRNMVRLLDENPEMSLVGEGWTKYYNAAFRTFRINTNSKHASLCATAWRTSFIPNVLEAIEKHKEIPFIDIRIFNDNKSVSLVVDTNFCIGIKGMPGRPGTGHAHHNMGRISSRRDPNLSVLSGWVGEDAKNYQNYYDPNRPELEIKKRQRVSRRRKRSRRVLAGRQLEIDEARKRRKLRG